MPRELTQEEIGGFLARVPQAASDVATHQELSPGVYSTTGNIPAYGRAYKDVGGTYVLVWIDASSRFHFIDLADRPDFAKEVNKPAYVSPSQGVFADITAQVTSGVFKPVQDLFDSLRGELNKVESDARNVIFFALIAVVVIAVVVAWRGVEAPGLRIG